MLRLEDRAQDDTVVVHPVGRLDVASYRQLRDHLLKVGADHPRAVVVDLTAVDVESGAPLAVFPVVHSRLQQWPGVPLLLVTGMKQIRRLLARNRFLRVHDSVPEAMAAIAEPPPRRVARLQLPNAVTSPSIAREFARRTCATWDLVELIDDAVLLVGELVTNAVMHTSCQPDIRLELCRDLFSVAVYDDAPGEVAVRDPGAGLTGIHGLLLVAQIATAWGYVPTSSGGKVVWATLRTV
ncbi:STAS domain-containing protein [Actinophytocola sp.]|uniref:STAS domain-containing protein n=1 Tax=Actinophytocola sp. TaxID=1872138 RepID=UPI002ED1EDE1